MQEQYARAGHVPQTIPRSRRCPVRRWESFLPGTGWAAPWCIGRPDLPLPGEMTSRLATRTKSATQGFLQIRCHDSGLGVTYDDSEPPLRPLRYLLAPAARGNIKGQIQPGGDPHGSPRSRSTDTATERKHFSGALFRKAATGLGYHPFPAASSNLSSPYTNPGRVEDEYCVFCGFCERYACEHYAKSTPQTFISRCWPTPTPSCAPAARCSGSPGLATKKYGYRRHLHRQCGAANSSSRLPW